MSTTKTHRPPLDFKGAAEYLGRSERWVRRAVAERRLTYLKMGKFVAFDPDDLDAYIEANKIEAVD